MKDINDINQYSGRGRPRVENPLTQAERAKAYRDRKREADMVKSDAVTVTDNHVKLSPSVGLLESRIVLLNAENMQLSDKLQAALDAVAALQAELISVTRHKKPKK
jgi:hypothetical protein